MKDFVHKYFLKATAISKKQLSFYVLSIICVLNITVLQAQSYQKLQQQVHVTSGKQKVAGVLKSIQQQSNYTYLYDPATVEGLEVNIPGAEMPLAELLQLLERQLALDIAFQQNTIAIRKRAAQQENANKQVHGTVQGKVFNEQNEPLYGVTIIAAPGKKVATSKVDGTYTLTLEPGKYSLQFSHLTYTTANINDVNVETGKVTTQDAVLYIKSSALKSVTVTGNMRRESIASLYNRQKNAAGISDGISADQVARTPDKNVGEVLKRISGLATVENKYVVVRGMSERYNGAMLNGQLMPSTELNRKNFSFDIIPSNIIDNITVLKTITPDMSAEFGGGLINVETKSIPTDNFLNISIGTSINNNTTGKDFKSLALEGREYWGRPSEHRNLFGKLKWDNMKDILANAEPIQNNGAGWHYPVKDPGVFADNWGIHQFKAQPSQNYQLSLGRVLHLKNEDQFGFVASASYRNTLQIDEVRMGRDGFAGSILSDGSFGGGFHGKQHAFTTNIGGMAGIGYTGQKNKLSLQTLLLNLLDQKLLFGRGLNGIMDNLPTLGYYDNTQWTKLWQTQLKGTHSLGNKGMSINWTATYIRMDRQRPDNHNMRSVVPDSSVKANEFTMTGPPTSTGVDGGMRWWTRAQEENLNWDINWSAPLRFNVGSMAVNNSLKIGYGGWYKDRLFYVATSGSGGSLAVPSSVQDFFDPAKAQGYNFYLDQFSDDFHRNAALHAAYGMLDHKIGRKIRLVWGARAEYYNLDRVNEVLDGVVKQINDSRGPDNEYDLSALYNREKNWKIFPSANLTYSLTPKMNLRLAYAESVIRPDLRELSFFKEYDFELGGVYESSTPIVSTDLKHLDFRYEYYPGPGEVLSFSLFYKQFDHPMEIFSQSTLNYFSLRNNKKAENRGMEVELRKSLAFTKVPVLKNITLYGNGTALFARVKTMTIDFNRVAPDNPKKILPVENVGPWEKRPQQGASNYMMNAGIYYDDKLLSLSLLYNYVTNRVFRPELVYAASLFERPIEALDAQVAIRLLKQKMQLRVNVSNLLNSYTIVYYNLYDNGAVFPPAGKTPSTKDFFYQKGKDGINYESRPGRTFSFTLNYNF